MRALFLDLGVGFHRFIDVKLFGNIEAPDIKFVYSGALWG